MLFVLMIAGFYLAISAIITLSYIGDTELSKIPIALRFDSTFKAINESSTINPGRSVNLDSLATDAWSKYETLKVSMAGITAIPKNTGLKKSLDRSFDSVNKVLTQHLKLFNNQKAQCARHIDLFKRQLKNAITKVNIDFKGSISSLPAGILSMYAEDLTNYMVQLPYEDYINDSYSRFAANHAVLSQAMAGCIKTLDILNAQLKAGPQNDTTGITMLSMPLLPAEADYSPILTGASSDILTQPKPRKIGSDYGAVFSLFIRWLGQGSTDVLLLVGMIGFGLFGSILSVFMTTDTGSDHNQNSLTHKTMLVVVKGFSAAIVVFLATRGGISILNSGSSNPNPLILFLFCFIGAIFSDPVWEWSKQKILGTFPKPTDEQNKAKDNGDPNAAKGKLPKPEVHIPQPDLSEDANKPK